MCRTGLMAAIALALLVADNLDDSSEGSRAISLGHQIVPVVGEILITEDSMS